MWVGEDRLWMGTRTCMLPLFSYTGAVFEVRWNASWRHVEALGVLFINVKHAHTAYHETDTIEKGEIAAGIRGRDGEDAKREYRRVVVVLTCDPTR